MTDMNESDPRSDVHYLGSSENKAWKKFQACTGSRGSLSFMSLSAVQIYDFHIFLTVEYDWVGNLPVVKWAKFIFFYWQYFVDWLNEILVDMVLPGKFQLMYSYLLSVFNRS